MGRFINKDPIEEQGGLNLYGFVRNNSVNKWDYLGMDELGPTVDLGRITFNYPRVPNEKGDPEDEYDSSQYPEPEAGHLGNAYDMSAIDALNADFNRRFGSTSPTVTGPIYGTLVLDTFVVTGQRAPNFSMPLPTTVTLGDIAGAAGMGAVNFGIGVVQGAAGVVTGTVETILHPIDTFRGTADTLGTLTGRIVYDGSGLANDIAAEGNNIINSPVGAQQFSRDIGRVTPAVIGSTALGAMRASRINRTAFRAQREAFWKAEAANNPRSYTPGDLERMRRGRAPTGPDGHPMELHHPGQSPTEPVEPMSRTDHRLGENYRKNHPTEPEK